jgi:hypothetical protein
MQLTLSTGTIILYLRLLTAVMTSRLAIMLLLRLASGGDHVRVRWFVRKRVSPVISLPSHRSTVLDPSLCSFSLYSEVLLVWDCEHINPILTQCGWLFTNGNVLYANRFYTTVTTSKLNTLRDPFRSTVCSSSEVESYRPISLLPIMSKLFEKLILKRLKRLKRLNIINEKHLVPTHQFGFRNNHSPCRSFPIRM